MRKFLFILIFLFPGFLFFLSTFSFAEEYWVSPTGNDSTGDGSQNNPWRHINYAIQQIGEDTLGIKRILNVIPGVYAPSTTGEEYPITMVANLWLKGTDSSNTVLDAEQTSHVINCWQTKNVKISELTIQNGIFSTLSLIGGVNCTDGAQVEIFNCIIQYCTGGGIFTANNTAQYKDSVTYVYAHHNTIKNNHTYGNGIKITGGDLDCFCNSFINNNSDDNTGSAIAMIGGAYRTPNVRIIGNIIKKGISNGGAIKSGHGNVLIENNIIIMNTTAGLFNDRGGGGIFATAVWDDTCIIRNNVIVNNTSRTFAGGISVLTSSEYPEMYFIIQKNIIAFNKAYGKGGAIGFHNGGNVIVGGFPGMGNDIFNNIGQDSINLFYHDLPSGVDTMNFRHNYLGNHPEKYHLYSQPDSLFDISNYTSTKNLCGVTYNCDSLFLALGLLSGINITTKEIVTEDFILYANYPNPFNPNTFFRYNLFKPLLVHLRIYNVLGEKVFEVFIEKQLPGIHTIQWNGKNKRGNTVSSGVYFYHFRIGEHIRVGKLVLNK